MIRGIGETSAADSTTDSTTGKGGWGGGRAVKSRGRRLRCRGSWFGRGGAAGGGGCLDPLHARVPRPRTQTGAAHAVPGVWELSSAVCGRVRRPADGSRAAVTVREPLDSGARSPRGLRSGGVHGDGSGGSPGPYGGAVRAAGRVRKPRRAPVALPGVLGSVPGLVPWACRQMLAGGVSGPSASAARGRGFGTDRAAGTGESQCQFPLVRDPPAGQCT